MAFINKFIIFPLCPHCLQESVAFYFSSAHNGVSFWVCGHCQKGVCAESQVTGSAVLNFNQLITIYPKPKPATAPKFTPPSIANLYLEATTCQKTKTFTAAAIVARKTIEVAVNQLGGTGSNLLKKIDHLATEHLITQSLAVWAHEIRLIGNDAAHELEPPTAEDVQQAIFFAEMFLTYAFTLPGMLEERRKSRT